MSHDQRLASEIQFLQQARCNQPQREPYLDTSFTWSMEQLLQAQEAGGDLNCFLIPELRTTPPHESREQEAGPLPVGAVGRCNDCGEVLWSRIRKHCVACGGREVVGCPEPLGQGESNTEGASKLVPDLGRRAWEKQSKRVRWKGKECADNRWLFSVSVDEVSRAALEALGSGARGLLQDVVHEDLALDPSPPHASVGKLSMIRVVLRGEDLGALRARAQLYGGLSAYFRALGARLAREASSPGLGYPDGSVELSAWEAWSRRLSEDTLSLLSLRESHRKDRLPPEEELPVPFSSSLCDKLAAAETLERIKLKVSPREWTVLEGRAAGRGLREIGDLLKVSRERVRQIEGKALLKARWVWNSDVGLNRPWIKSELARVANRIERASQFRLELASKWEDYERDRAERAAQRAKQENKKWAHDAAERAELRAVEFAEARKKLMRGKAPSGRSRRLDSLLDVAERGYARLLNRIGETERELLALLSPESELTDLEPRLGALRKAIRDTSTSAATLSDPYGRRRARSRETLLRADLGELIKRKQELERRLTCPAELESEVEAKRKTLRALQAEAKEAAAKCTQLRLALSKSV